MLTKDKEEKHPTPIPRFESEATTTAEELATRVVTPTGAEEKEEQFSFGSFGEQYSLTEENNTQGESGDTTGSNNQQSGSNTQQDEDDFYDITVKKT